MIDRKKMRTGTSMFLFTPGISMGIYLILFMSVTVRLPSSTLGARTQTHSIKSYGNRRCRVGGDIPCSRTELRCSDGMNGGTSECRPSSSGPSSERERIMRELVRARAIAIPFLSPMASSARSIIDRPLNDPIYHKALVNRPSDDFWYPPYMIGRWNTTLRFEGATFTDRIPLEALTRNDHLPGFSRYSVIFLPEPGKDVNCLFRYAEVDSHPREDHPFNIRQLVESSLPDTTIESAAYSFQKAPTWLSSPANHWNIKYSARSEQGTNATGLVELLTQKRDIQVSAGLFETTEFFQQTHTRIEPDMSGKDRITTRKSDYALHWRLSLPASGRDEFVAVDSIRKADTIVGSLDVLLYLQPTDDLYKTVPGSPAGVLSYSVTMERIQGVGDRPYPFVGSGDGPVELEEYFKY